MEKQEISRTQKIKSGLKNSLTFKIISIGILVLILMIPKSMIQGLIYERESFRAGAVREVSQSWGTHQTITGPVVTIPYSYWTINDKKEKIAFRYNAYFLPEELEITGTIEDKIKKRGIFEIILYKSDLNISGKFKKPDFSKLHIDDKDVHCTPLGGAPNPSLYYPQVNLFKKRVSSCKGDNSFSTALPTWG